MPEVRLPNSSMRAPKVATPSLGTKIANKLKKWEVVTSANMKSFIEGQKFVGVKESYMIENAVNDGRMVHFAMEDGTTRFYLERPVGNPFYKDGPYFEFYDQDLFYELERSKSLGLEILPDQDNFLVSVAFPEVLAETPIVVDGTEMLLREMFLDVVIPALPNYHMGYNTWNGSTLQINTYESSKVTPAQEASMLKQLNNWFEEFNAYRNWADLNGGADAKIHFNSRTSPAGFWVETPDYLLIQMGN